MQTNVDPLRNYYKNIYGSRPPIEHEWTAGSPPPELINLVWSGVIAPGSRVLELGCGIGTISSFLAVRGLRVTSVDLSSNAIALARKMAAVFGCEVDFRVSDIFDLAISEGEYDVVVDQGCFHHMQDAEREPYEALVYKALRPGGLYVLQSFSDQIPGGPEPRRVKSSEILGVFSKNFDLEHLSRVASFSSGPRDNPKVWFCYWYKRAS